MSAMRSYKFYDAVIGVDAGAPGLAAWLDEFLLPAFVPTVANPHVRVRVDTSGVAYDAALATRPAAAGAPAPCFALDREVVHHPAWHAAGRTVLADAKYRVCYAVDGARVDVLVHPASVLFRTSVMRVIREIATAAALDDPGRLQLHAGACAIDARGVVVAGPKGAGKTTLLAYLAGAAGADVVSNDRVVVAMHGHPPMARGVPTIVSIRPETHSLLPHLFSGLRGLDRPAHRTLAETNAAAAGDTGPIVRLTMSPAQLARQLGVARRGAAALAAVVFPGRHARPGACAIRRLAAPEAAVRLLESRFGLRAARTGPTIFETMVGARRDPRADARCIDELAATLPCFAVDLAPDRFRTPDAAEQVLAAVCAPGRGT